MSRSMLDIIIPTWNNPQYLIPCISSIKRTGVCERLNARIIVVNNGTYPHDKELASYSGIHVLNAPEDHNQERMNLRWEGGLKYGLEFSDSPYVVFQNDDTLIPPSNIFIYDRMMSNFNDPRVAAVGPLTNCAMNEQSIFHAGCPMRISETNLLIFFMVMLDRKALDEVGGIDDSFCGGDDFDLSIRFRKMGKTLRIDPNCFLYHHGFKSGERLMGQEWNSAKSVEERMHHLIRKHSLRDYLGCFNGVSEVRGERAGGDIEGDICREYLQGKKIVEMGCGGVKTADRSIGIDLFPYGQEIPRIRMKSKADIVADCTKRLPMNDCSVDTVIARHLLEHCIDTIETLEHWNRILKMNGRLIISVPDETRGTFMPVNPEHRHVFTKNSLKHLVSQCGFKDIEIKDSGNGISFIGIFEKVLHKEHCDGSRILEPVTEARAV